MFAEKLKILRLEFGLSQEQFATKMRISKASISNYENGVRIPDADFIVKVAKYFNVSTDFLLDLTDVRQWDKKQRLFVDMDGTLAVFRRLNTLEPLYEKGYFLNLEPMKNVIAAIKQIVAGNPDIEVFILSAVLSDSPYALDEKNDWLDKYLPEISPLNRIFTPCGHDKKEYIHIRPNDYLLDDYTDNLNKWQPPAKGIKLLNGINHTRGTWENDCIRYDKAAADIAKDIINVMKGRSIVRDTNPLLEKMAEQLSEQTRATIQRSLNMEDEI